MKSVKRLVRASFLALFLAALAVAPAAFAQQAPTVYPQQEGFVDAHGVLIYYVALARIIREDRSEGVSGDMASPRRLLSA